MQRHERLRSRRDFSAVYQRGRSVGNRLLALRVLSTDSPHTRFGFSVSKRLGNAVRRNRIKRRLREIARSLPVGGGWDIVVIARQDASESDFQALQGAFTDVARRAGIALKPSEAGLER